MALADPSDEAVIAALQTDGEHDAYFVPVIDLEHNNVIRCCWLSDVTVNLMRTHRHRSIAKPLVITAF